jgi:hypothetical protein
MPFCIPELSGRCGAEQYRQREKQLSTVSELVSGSSQIRLGSIADRDDQIRSFGSGQGFRPQKTVTMAKSSRGADYHFS